MYEVASIRIFLKFIQYFSVWVILPRCTYEWMEFKQIVRFYLKNLGVREFKMRKLSEVRKEFGRVRNKIQDKSRKIFPIKEN